MECGVDADSIRNPMAEMNDYRDLGMPQQEQYAEPNCEFVDVVDRSTGLPQVVMVTIRDVNADEELTTSYGDAYFNIIDLIEQQQQ